MVEALDGLPLPAAVVPGQQPQADPGLLPRPRDPDVPAAIRVIDKLDKLPAEDGRRAAGRRRRRHAEQAEQCLALADDPRGRHVVRRARPRRSASRTSCSRPAWPSWPRSSTAAPACVTTTSRSRPTSGSRAVSTTTPARSSRSSWRATSASSPWAAAVGTTRWPATAGRRTPASASPSASPAPWSRCIADGVLAGSRAVPSAVLVALADEESRPASDAVADRAARPRHPVRGRREPRRSSASRSGTPSGAASRSSGSRSDDGGHQVKDIRSGDQVDADPDAWAPPAEDLRPDDRRPTLIQRQEQTLVIRTHDAGALRAEHVGQTVTLAGWVARRRDHGGVAFIDLREASGVAQVVVRDEAVAHQPAHASTASQVTGEVAPRPEGNANPNLPTGEIEVIADDRRGPERRRAAAVPDRRATSTWGRRRASSTATSTCAGAARPRRCGCAARSTRPPATCSTGTTSSRSRPRR